MTKKFSAFKERNFRLYFYGQLVSFVGTWLQNLAQGWLIFELTHSAIWTGAVTSAITIPGAMFATFGGVVIDQFGARRVMYATNALSIFPPLTLGILTLTHLVTPLQVLVLAFLGGIVNAFDSPARQVIINEAVRTEEQLISAISINTAMIQASQFIGPGIAGFLILKAGLGWTFVINAFSFIAVLTSLALMRLQEHPAPQKKSILVLTREGILYSLHHREIATLICIFTFVGTFGYSFRAILPVIAGDLFHDGPKVLSYLAIASGIGAVVGTLSVTLLQKKVSRMLIIVGTLAVGISLILFPYAATLGLAFLLFFFAGAGFSMATTMVRAITQIIVAEDMRGRTMGILTMSFFAGIGIGSFATGLAARHFNPASTIQVNGILLLLFGIGMVLLRNKIPTTAKKTKKVQTI